MADPKEIQPEMLEMFDINRQYDIDQSFSMDKFLVQAPNGNAVGPTLQYQIPRLDGRLIDLTNSFIRAEINLNSTTALTPNCMIALSNNALLHLFSQVTLKMNGTMVETYTQNPGVFNTMMNLLYYSKEYSTSTAALTNLCWSIDYHKFYTINNAGTPAAPNTVLTGNTASSLSSGMANSVNCLKNMVTLAPNAAIDQSYVNSVGENMKYSSGFDARHKLLFNELAGTNDNAVQIVPKGTKMTFHLPLSHIFSFVKSTNKVIVGGFIDITLQKDNSNWYKALNIDRTPMAGTIAAGPPAVVTVDGRENYKFLQTYPTCPASGADAASNWGASYKNIQSPWVDMNNSLAGNNNYPFSGMSISYNDWSLYARIVEPKDIIYASIMEEVSTDKGIFYNTKYITNTIYQMTTSPTHSIQLSTDVKKPEFFVFAFQTDSGTPITSTTYTAGSNYYGLSTGSRTTDGASNFSVFDPLRLKEARLNWGSYLFPEQTVDFDWFNGDYHYFLKNIELFRKEYLGIDDGAESSPAIDSTNWLNLYPLYIIDMRARRETISDAPSAPSQSSLKLQFYSNVPAGTSMYYMFFGNSGFRINNTSCVR